jgi:hypothetical protein
MQTLFSNVVQNRICNEIGQMVFEWQARENDVFFSEIFYKGKEQIAGPKYDKAMRKSPGYISCVIV